MQRYEISPPRSRAVLGLAAVAMTALTIAVAVVVPAHSGPGVAEARTLADAKRTDPDRTEVVITPSRIDVVAERGRKSALDATQSNRRRES
jgi:hypothetical protein